MDGLAWQVQRAVPIAAEGVDAGQVVAGAQGLRVVAARRYFLDLQGSRVQRPGPVVVAGMVAQFPQPVQTCSQAQVVRTQRRLEDSQCPFVLRACLVSVEGDQETLRARRLPAPAVEASAPACPPGTF